MLVALEELVEAEERRDGEERRTRPRCAPARAPRPVGRSRRGGRGGAHRRRHPDPAPHGLVPEAAVLVAEERDRDAPVRVARADPGDRVEIDRRVDLGDVAGHDLRGDVRAGDVEPVEDVRARRPDEDRSTRGQRDLLRVERVPGHDEPRDDGSVLLAAHAEVVLGELLRQVKPRRVDRLDVARRMDAHRHGRVDDQAAHHQRRARPR